jgi:hypothetical protein
VAAGLRAVWLNRAGPHRQGAPGEVPEIATLADLPAMLAALARG